VIVGLFASAAITLLMSLVNFVRLGGILHWLMGGLATLGYQPVLVMAAGCGLGLGLIYAQARALNLLALGEEAALQLGVEAERVKRLVFVAASLLTGVVVAHTGPIGFVGLIVPHAVRLAIGPDNRVLIPAAAGAGAAFLVLADTLARLVIRPAELPVGVITAFCGAPFFVYLLRTRFRRGLV
jgi:iron complex transport system permease protein